MVASRTPEPGRVEHVGSDVQREVLPIPDRRQIGLTTYDAKDPDTSYPPITRLRPPAGAPNVLVVLIDDVGFGPPAPSAARSTCPRPSGSPPVA
jgi:hypothetical protein